MPEGQRPRIALWGGASLSNVGDRLLFDVVQDGLGRRLPGAEFARFCPWAPGGDQDGSGARPLWVGQEGTWPGAGSFDAVVILGGVFAGPPFSNVLMQAFTLGASPGRFDPRVVAAWHGVGLNDGTHPASRPEWQDYLRAVAGRLDHFTVRAPEAASRFRQAGAPVPGLVPDPVFARPPAAAPRPPARGRRPRIGVAAGDAVTSSRLLGTFTDRRVVARYVRNSGFDRTTCLDAAAIAGQDFAEDEMAPKRGFLDRLAGELAQLQRVGTVELIGVDNMYDDAATSGALAARLGGVPVHRVPGAQAGELAGMLGRYDLVVVSRLHSAVLAMQAGVPFVAADPYWHPRAGTSKVHQLLAGLGSTARHWTGAEPMTCLAGAALAGAADDRDRYLAQHSRALDALDALAAVISGGR